MKHIFILLILSTILQGNQNYPVIVLKGKPEIFTIDKFDYVYVYQDDVLKKYTPEGKPYAQYSSVDFGHISRIDVSDPLQTVLFFKEFNTVLFADKKFNQIGPAIHLDMLGFSSIDAVCKSKQFGFWLYDTYLQRIILYGFNPGGIKTEINLLRYTKPLGPMDEMLEYGDDLYLHRSGSAIYVYNHLGGHLDILPLEKVNDFQVKNKCLYYSENGILFNYNLDTEKRDTIKLDKIRKFEEIRLGNGKIFVLNNDSISIIPFNQF